MAINQPFLESTPKLSSSTCKTLSLSLIFFAALISSALFAIQYSLKTTPFRSTTNPISPLKICDQSIDKQSCHAMVLEASEELSDNHDHNHLLKACLEKTKPKLQQALEAASDLCRRINTPISDRAAVLDCVQLLDLSKDRVTDSITTIGHSHEDVHTWLSAVLTNHVTCLDALEDGSASKTLMEPHLKELILRARTSLAIHVSDPKRGAEEGRPAAEGGEFPTWVGAGDRRLLRAVAGEVKEANLVVAKDGSGNYKTIKEAVAAVPEKSKSRFVIYVKKGTYKENVEIGKNKKNVMIVGDGMDLTIVTGSLNVVDGATTFKSATLAAVGDGFIAQDMWFQNTAGPQKHQAVALRVGADQSVINRCRVDAFQDTLYAHSNRQFYRDSTVTGTVDFIFGNAAVVLQNCTLVPRKPMPGQKNMVTAQGRVDPNQNTGTSAQACRVVASSDLEPVQAQFPTFLGRPWKEYSRTVFMQSYIADVIDPAGWAEWDKDFALKTLYYGEYLNKGPGAGTSKRVKWAGFRVITSPKEAQKFTVAELIQGGAWLQPTGVAYTEGL